MIARRGTNIVAMESRKRKLSGRGRGPAEPVDTRIGREIAGKVGNSKKVMIGQTRRFGQVWAEMVVLFFVYFCCCCYFSFDISFPSPLFFCLFANALSLLMF